MAYNNVTNKIKICKKEKKLTGQFSFYKQFDFKVPFIKKFQNTQVNSSFLFHTNHTCSKQKIN